MPSITPPRHADVALALLVTLLAVADAAAETVEVKMVNYDRDDPSRVMVFVPEIVRVSPGDTVRFVAVDELHNAVSIDGMIPDGAAPWASPLSEDFEVTFEVEGTYGFLCQPHAMMGMVGLVLVGDHTRNLSAAKAVPHTGPAKERFDALFAQIERP